MTTSFHAVAGRNGACSTEAPTGISQMSKPHAEPHLQRPPSDPSPVYPWMEAVAPGDTIEVAPGVHWLRMPLPFPTLDHINLWLLDDGKEFVFVDTGFADDRTRALWDEILGGRFAGRRAGRVVCTHYHSDHASLAGWLTGRFGSELWMSHGEFYASHSVHGEVANHEPEHMYRMYLANGLDKPMADRLLELRNNYRRNVVGFPSSFHRMMDGDELRIGGRRWQVVSGYGHSPEHSALYCDELRVMIAGDMVLPRITTNVSVQATEPNGNPLQLFINSLARHARFPADTLVLPAHGLPFRGLHGRIAFLQAHHQERLEELVVACARPQSAADILPVLFRRKLDAHTTGIAMGEAMAHLHYLNEAGRLDRTTAKDGIIRFIVAKDGGVVA
jgi:glyoxylase-like metal-dependent hydrolase (beta-lactamase superfamily II)